MSDIPKDEELCPCFLCAASEADQQREDWVEWAFEHRVSQRSLEAISSILKGCVGKKLLFIDGDHSYTGVLADYTAVKSHLNEGDLILFHDTSGERRIGRFIQRHIDNNACFKVSSFDTRNGMVLGEVINEV